MPACSNPPNRPPDDVINRLIDEVAWAKTCLLITASTAPGSSDRDRELGALKRAVIAPRRAIDEILANDQVLPHEVLVTLRMCEMAIPKLEAGAILRQDRQEKQDGGR
jgi:hypothetical protein